MGRFIAAKKNTTPQSKQELRAAKQMNCRIEAGSSLIARQKLREKANPAEEPKPWPGVLLGVAKPNGNKEKLLTEELANRVQSCAEDGPKIKCTHTLKRNRMSKNLPRSWRTKQKNYIFWHGRLNPVERKYIRRKWNRKRLESSRSGTDASTENKNNLQIDAKIETDEKRPAAEESCTVTETEPVKTSGPLAATSADGLRSEQEQLSRGPDAKAQGSTQRCKEKWSSRGPRPGVRIREKKKKVSDEEVPTQNKMQIILFHWD
jgi:hypothetical protein